MTVQCKLPDGSQVTGSDEQLWRDVLSGSLAVSHALLYEGDTLLAEWRDGMMWIYNGTLNGIDAMPPPPL